MIYVRAFAPWIVFAIVSSFDWRYGALAGLVVALGLVGAQRRRHASWDALILESGSAVFFAAMTVFSFAWPDSPAESYVTPMSNGWLAVIAWVSLLIRRPFTLGIAKQATEEEIWNSPIFLRVNVVISAVWAASFTIGAALYAIVQHSYAHPGTATTIIVIASFVVPIIFTIRYPEIVRARYQPGASA